MIELALVFAFIGGLGLGFVVGYGAGGSRAIRYTFGSPTDNDSKY